MMQNTDLTVADRLYFYSYALIPESFSYLILAGLLTYPISDAFPSLSKKNENS